MKKITFTIMLIAFMMTLKAQQPQSPLFFHNHLEYMTYRMEHPNGIPFQAPQTHRGDYTLKLDSVVGSDNFDWTRWKNVYTYNEEAEQPNDDKMVETNYEWRDQAWVPTYLSEINGDSTLHHRWNDEGWEPYYREVYQYTECNGNRLVESVTREQFDSVWMASMRYTYEYDDNCNVLLTMIYDRLDSAGEWMAGGKYEYNYDEQGGLVSSVYYSVRDGNWNATQKDTLTYDEQHQCISLLSQRKGGWGPFANQWMNDYRYDFEYEDGKLLSETYYVGGWFGSGMSMDSKSEYQFDANGNEVMKVASIYNEVDWIVRDVYENQFDLSVDAASILGLASIWESTLNRGMGFVLGMEMPLNNKWQSCSIASANLDTEFTLYYSGFANVGEYQEAAFQVCSGAGCLTVESAEPADVTVYDLLGRRVAFQKNAIHCEFQLNAGLYLVGNGTSFVKAVVR